MQTVQPFEYFSEDVSDDGFGNLLVIVVDQIDHGSSIDKLDKHEEGFLVVIGEEVFGEVVGVAQIHYCDLFADFVESAFVFQFDDSARVIFACVFLLVVGEEDFAHGSLPELFLEDELSCGVLLEEVHAFDHGLKLPGGQQFCFYVAFGVSAFVLFLVLYLDELVALEDGRSDFADPLGRHVLQVTVFYLDVVTVYN